MKSLALFLLIISIVFIVIGYMDIYLKSKYAQKKIEYRFIPRSVYDEIDTNMHVLDKYSDLFNSKDAINKRSSLYTSNLV